MKNITEIDPIKYDHYFLVEDHDDIFLKFFTSFGYIDVDQNEYECFSTDSGTLIAFVKKHSGHQNYAYSLNGEDKYIQCIHYEDLVDIFDRTSEDFVRMYTFLNSIEIPSKDVLSDKIYNENDLIRCDYNKFGPVPFYSSTNPINIKKVRCILNITGIGHILCIDTFESENPNPNSQTRNTGGATLSGVIKTIKEWSNIFDDPFNSEESIAKKSKEFINSIGIPNDALNEISESEVNMRVYRYLQGEERSDYSFQENNIVPESLKNFFKIKCSYPSLYNLNKTHPFGSSIPSSVIEKENSVFNDYIEYICKINNITYTSFQDLRKKIINNQYDFLAIPENDIVSILNVLIENE